MSTQETVAPSFQSKNCHSHTALLLSSLGQLGGLLVEYDVAGVVHKVVVLEGPDQRLQQVEGQGARLDGLAVVLAKDRLGGV